MVDDVLFFEIVGPRATLELRHASVTSATSSPKNSRNEIPSSRGANLQSVPLTDSGFITHCCKYYYLHFLKLIYYTLIIGFDCDWFAVPQNIKLTALRLFTTVIIVKLHADATSLPPPMNLHRITALFH